MDCLPCFGNSKPKDGEREPLLPKYHPTNEQPTPSAPPPEILRLGDDSIVDKIIDALAALNAGKIPTQEQTTRFLQVLLRSEVLKEDKSGDVVPGNGPASRQGRKVLKDVRCLLQALLQFGMEKNADNKLQEIYFQLASLDKSPVSVQVKVDSHNSIEKAQKASEAALDNTAHASDKIKAEAPRSEELAFDATTLISALRTIFETCLSSSVFRLLLSDIVSILRDLVAHTAADVQRVAIEVQQVAEDVEQKALNQDSVNDITAADENGHPKKDLVSNTMNDVKEKGKEVAHKIGDTAKQEWNDVGDEAMDKTKEKLLERIRQTLSKIQQDPASRSAMRSILILARKYAEKIGSASEALSSAFEETIVNAKDAVDVAGGDHKPNYPPHPYDSASTSGPSGSEKTSLIDMTSDAILEDIKDMLQRVAKGHSLDALLNAFSRIVQGLNKMPVAISKDVEKRTGRMTRSASSLISESGSQHHPSSPPDGNQPQEQTQAPSKKRKNGKARKRQKAHDLKAGVLGLAPPSPISASNSQDSTMSVRTGRDEENGTEELHEEEEKGGQENPLPVYFRRLGDYFDRAIEEKDWAISKEGERTLEDLFVDGAELVNVVGESVSQAEDESSNLTEEDRQAAERGTKLGSNEDEIRRQFKKDIKYFVDEAEAYVSAFEKDKTTMKLVREFEHLGIDLRALVSKGARQGKKSLTQSLMDMTGWTQWVGWAIPRLLRMLPIGAIPIPSIEFMTPDVEGALQAIFVQGLAKGSERTSEQMQYSSSDPVATSLVPDEVVVKQWTELRIDMADYDRPLGGQLRSKSSFPASSSFGGASGPGVQTTSRVRMHLDGVRARVEGMGYYFKYKGGYLGYEDEGIASVDLGMGKLHRGFAVDVEIEMEHENVAFAQQHDQAEEGNAGEDEEHDCARSLIVESETTEIAPANLDVQTALHRQNTALGRSWKAINDHIDAERQPSAPLFRVVDVDVELRGLHFRFDKSRHWIINKLFVQPLAGPIVAKVVKQSMEKKIRETMEDIAVGLGDVSRDAARRAEKRQRSSDEEDGLSQTLRDWWGAMLKIGPTIFGRSAIDNEDERVDVQTKSNVETTSKGLIYKNVVTTKVTDAVEPAGIPAAYFNPITNTMEPVNLSIADIDSKYQTPPTATSEEETIIAVGGGAQLFPGKPGAYGVDHEDSDETTGLLDTVKQKTANVIDNAKGGVSKGVDVVESAGERWEERNKNEQTKKTWKSDAFNF